MFSNDPFANIRRLITAPVQSMRTYQIAQPLHTHFRVATCAEVDCPAYLHGWKMGFDLSDDEKAAAARRIRDHSGRRYTAELIGERPNQRVVFTFPAGQRCFQRHRVPLERDPFLVVRGGDWRGNPMRERVQHRDPETFVDQWANDLDRLNTVRDRG